MVMMTLMQVVMRAVKRVVMRTMKIPVSVTKYEEEEAADDAGQADVDTNK